MNKKQENKIREEERFDIKMDILDIINELNYRRKETESKTLIEMYENQIFILKEILSNSTALAVTNTKEIMRNYKRGVKNESKVIEKCLF